MSKTLIVIEAPGKISSLKNILDEIGFEEPAIFATKGRLFDIAHNKIAISHVDYSPSQITEVKPSIIKNLKSLLSKVDTVYLMTDNDGEGHLIANQVASLCNDSHVVHRIKCPAFTKDFVLNALSNPSKQDPADATASRLRRVTDRLISYGLSKKEYSSDGDQFISANVGRVLSPLIASLSKQKHPTAKLSLSTQHKPRDAHSFTNSKTFTATEIKEANKTLIESTSLFPPILEKESTVYEIPTNRNLLNGMDALMLGCSELKISAEETFWALQKNYEIGNITYSRTESRYLPDEMKATLAQLATHYGTPNFNPEKIAQNNQDDTKSHTGIIPLNFEMAGETNYEHMTNHDAIMALITNHTLAAGTPLKTFVEVKKVENSPANTDWIRWARRHNIELQFERRFQSPSVNGPRRYFPNKHNDESTFNATIEHLTSDEIVLNQLNLLQLSKPSTAHLHTKKTIPTYIDKSGNLTRLGNKSNRRALEICPQIVKGLPISWFESRFTEPDIENKVKIESVLTGLGIKDIVDRALIAERELTLDPENSIKQEHSEFSF